ncbi:MAG TPA: DNA replication/repair protein RecF [Steroidobacteraceae bacterium]|nr:DNA replication/repair protein RecF [Steroidobacteraceae bacterium]
MALRSVRLQQFRCFDSVDLELDRRLTRIQGANGSGKTSLLEAIFLLGRGRSFRSSRLDLVVRHGQPGLAVAGLVERATVTVPVQVEHAAGETVARIRGQRVASLSELSMSFPVQIIEPGVHKLIEEGPVRRRRFLDWGTFHVEPAYLSEWQRFHRALRQRNAALRARVSLEDLEPWNDALSIAGERVDEARARYLGLTQSYLVAACADLLGRDVSFAYVRGWPEELLRDALERAQAFDYLRRVTSVGPHRADLRIEVDGRPAKDVVSRGQQKLLAAGLLLGQLEFHIAQQGLQPTVLLDDPAAELDEATVRRFTDRIFRLDTQIVLTSLAVQSPGTPEPGRVFHVEQGEVRQML